MRVDPSFHSALDVGDEPLLLAQAAPTWIARNRYEGAEAARYQGARIIIMDDGLQNRQLIHDCRLMVVDGTYGFGNGLVFPAGPLRENLRLGLKAVHAVLIIDDNNIQMRYNRRDITFNFQSVTTVDVDHGHGRLSLGSWAVERRHVGC